MFEIKILSQILSHVHHVDTDTRHFFLYFYYSFHSAISLQYLAAGVRMAEYEDKLATILKLDIDSVFLELCPVLISEHVNAEIIDWLQLNMFSRIDILVARNRSKK